VLLSKLGGRRPKRKPSLWLHAKESLITTMKACNLETVEATYYDFNVCVPPFDSEYPNRARALNRWTETHFTGRLPSLVHTAFLLKARRAT
jgi:hypothetical protein